MGFESANDVITFTIESEGYDHKGFYKLVNPILDSFYPQVFIKRKQFRFYYKGISADYTFIIG